MHNIPIYQLGKIIGSCLIDKKEISKLGGRNIFLPIREKYLIVYFGHKRIRLHRLILNIYNPSIIIDHINGDIYDNRKQNLRIVSRIQNGQNRTVLNINNSSGYRNVSWHKKTGSWMVSTRYNHKCIYWGLYKSKNEANKKAIKARKILGFANTSRKINSKSPEMIIDIINSRPHQKLRRDNISGFAGITWHISHKVWQATIKHDGKYIYIGQSKKLKEIVRKMIKRKTELNIPLQKTEMRFTKNDTR